MENIKRKISVLVLIGMLVGMGLVVVTPVSATGGAIQTPPGLVSWWPGDGNANDIIGNNHGSLKNGATFATGYVTSGNGEAFSLDGVDDYIEVPDSPSLDIINEMTIEMWIKPASTQKQYTDLLDKKHSPASAESAWVVQQWGYSHNSYCFAWYDNGWYGWAGTKAYQLTADVFQHFTIVFASGNVKMYHNGIKVLEYTEISTTLNTNDEPLTIGANTEGLDRYFNGIIDEIGIYNRALSSSEIQAIYDADSAGKYKPEHITPPSGLISWWPGDKNANDIVDNNPGTTKNGVTFQSGAVDWAFSFDGLDDRIDVTDAPNLDLTGDFTIDFWVNPAYLQKPYADILRKEDNSHENGFGIEMDGSANSNRYFAGWKDPDGHLNCWLYNSFQLTPGVWQHVAVTKLGITRSVYIDGQLVPSATSTGDNAIIATNDASLQIGAWTVFPGREWKGMLDELEIFNRVLSSTEIQSIYNAGAAGKCKTQNIEIAPMSVEFGDVEVGSSTAALVTISNTGITDLTVSSISIPAGGSGDYSITSIPTLPAVISPEGTIDVEITFLPTAEGPSSAVLQVSSDDPEQALLEVDLSGTGVITELPPEQQIAEILTFFDASVAEGNLVGNGPGNSANGRKGALRNMLEAASDLIYEGSIDKACEQLYDAYKRTDGNPRPPEFVSGPAASELATKILNLIDTLSC